MIKELLKLTNIELSNLIYEHKESIKYHKDTLDLIREDGYKAEDFKSYNKITSNIVKQRDELAKCEILLIITKDSPTI